MVVLNRVRQTDDVLIPHGLDQVYRLASITEERGVSGVRGRPRPATHVYMISPGVIAVAFAIPSIVTSSLGGSVKRYSTIASLQYAL